MTKAGFTLIELSIVLVIIGLIVGGVLVGGDLIHAAEQRATVAQIEKLNSAINTFKLKFGCLPADCINASSLGFVPVNTSIGPLGPGGNGDDMIDHVVGQLVEPYYIIGILQQSGLWGDVVIERYDNLPSVALKVSASDVLGYIGGFWPQYMATGGATNPSISQNGHYYWATSASGMDNWTNITIFTTADAFAIDTKIDDGLPRSGSIMAAGTGVVWGYTSSAGVWTWVPTFVPGTDDASPPGPSNAHCVGSGTPDVYNTQNNSPSLCSITIKAAF